MDMKDLVKKRIHYIDYDITEQRLLNMHDNDDEWEDRARRLVERRWKHIASKQG